MSRILKSSRPNKFAKPSVIQYDGNKLSNRSGIQFICKIRDSAKRKFSPFSSQCSSYSVSRSKLGTVSSRSISPLTNRLTVSRSSSSVVQNTMRCVFTFPDCSKSIIAAEEPISSNLLMNISSVGEFERYLKRQENEVKAFRFDFDQVYSEESGQRELYEDAVRPIFEKAVSRGRSGAVVLFGPSLSGKTYSMIGRSKTEKGLIFRGVEDLCRCASLSSSEGEYLIQMSVCLLHSNQALDMLAVPQSSSERYKQIHNPKDLIHTNIKDEHDVTVLLKKVFKQLHRMPSEFGNAQLDVESHLIISFKLMRRNPTDIEDVLNIFNNILEYILDISY